MALFCFTCKACGAVMETPVRDSVPSCATHGVMARDYKGEQVGVGSGVRVSRDGTVRDQAELFLPTNRDFAGPGDPDGKVGMRKWRDKHGPKDDNKRPFWPGEVERKTFALS